MNRRHLLSACAASVTISGCAGSLDSGTPSPTRTDSDSNNHQPAERGCSPIPDLTITNLTPRPVTVTITITAVTERYRGESPTPTKGKTPFEETPVQTFSDTFELEAYSPDDHNRNNSKDYDTVPRKFDWHSLEVDVEEGPEKAFPFKPPYGKNKFEVTIDEDRGLYGGKQYLHCD